MRLASYAPRAVDEVRAHAAHAESGRPLASLPPALGEGGDELRRSSAHDGARRSCGAHPSTPGHDTRREVEQLGHAAHAHVVELREEHHHAVLRQREAVLALELWSSVAIRAYVAFTRARHPGSSVSLNQGTEWLFRPRAHLRRILASATTLSYSCERKSCTHKGADVTTTQASIETRPEAGTYALDPSHSVVSFAARHLMVSKVRGRFEVSRGP